ncbi:MAG TPA: regulatory protein RecX [Solirubrobacteraceae bacterium]|nr:regulatory protein RecX [Solirubrobacteraceae bacterium]
MAVGGLLARDDPGARLAHALDLAYRWLGHRDRTVAEMRRHLEAKRVEPATIDATVGELQAQGYLDDAGYARRFAEDRRRLDGWGAERIERRLQALGVAPADVAAALGPHDDGLELEAAVEVLRRRVRAAPRDDRERERALGMLARRGYDLEVAYAAVRRFERDA